MIMRYYIAPSDEEFNLLKQLNRFCDSCLNMTCKQIKGFQGNLTSHPSNRLLSTCSLLYVIF